MATKKNAKLRLRAPKERSPDEAMRQLGAQLKIARVAMGLQQVEAARRVGWGKDRLCRVENGTRTLSAVDKSRLCALYGISEAQLEGLREGDKAITGRYMALDVIDRNNVTKSGKGFQLEPVAKQTICLDWLAPHVSKDELRILEGTHGAEDQYTSESEFVVLDCSTRKIQNKGVYLIWSFGAATLNRCEPDLRTGQINVQQAKAFAAVAPEKIEVIGKVVGAWRRM